MTAHLDFKDGVAHITLDDGKVNVMNAAMLRSIGAALDEAATAKAPVVLRGRPGIFSAGFDLKVFASGDAAATYELMSLGSELALRLLTFPHPVIALATGHAYPMGCFLLLASDIRIGVEGPFRMGLNEVTINIAPPQFAIELARLRMTPAYLQRTTLLGEMFDPEAAVTAGILDKTVPAGDLEAALAGALRQLKGVDPASHTETMRRVRSGAAAIIRAAIDAEIRLETYQGRSGSRVLLPGQAA